MLTKTLTCYWCGKTFERTGYPSSFGIYEKTCCSKRCAVIGAREGYRPTQWIVLGNNGHYVVRLPDHPRANKNNQVPLAHIIMEERLGYYLGADEVVHHVDGNPLNNDPTNLQIMTLGEHVTLHNSLKGRDKHGRFIKTVS